jgi:murein DD-endopeptidase MepM/ murein hydrolase activator NlpD
MDRRLLFAALLGLLPLLAACSDTPETELSWDVNDHLGHRPAPRPQTSARADSPHVYVYEDSDLAPLSPPVPTPRPSYNPAPAYAAVTPPRYAPAYAPASGTVAFAWPVNGNVISGFGTATNGERNDGINIATAMNAPIHAAAGGTVDYADSLNGYGKLVLIRHANGYVTAYAHADRLLVARGDFVAKGQVIGYAGQTGDVTSPQLHFEIRRGTAPVDPRALLTARAGA